ncbi:MAG: hypothetical protein Fur0041_01820 [Bacteroidia bacterium]
MFALTITNDVISQCNKTWIKKKCVPKINPFIHNGQTNSTLLKEGGQIESTMTFYSGQDYRILVCAEETLENVWFEVSDMTGKTIFDSRKNNDSDIFDFKVKSTTELKIRVAAGKNEGGSGNATGCVSILVGFKSK